jgi:hypothetical protein
MIVSRLRHISLIPTMAVVIGVGIAACGGSIRSANRDSESSSAIVVRATGSSVVPRRSRHQPYLNDGDKDKVYDEEAEKYRDNSLDNDKDPSEDYKRDDNGDYHDSDDSTVVAFGHPATASDVRAITSIAKRYYSVIAAKDGSTACLMIPPNLARNVPRDYGQGSAGPLYLRRAKSCPEVMRLLFVHSRSTRGSPFTSTGVRIRGNHAYVLLGSRTGPASYIQLERVDGAWMILGLVGVALP